MYEWFKKVVFWLNYLLEVCCFLSKFTEFAIRQNSFAVLYSSTTFLLIELSASITIEFEIASEKNPLPLNTLILISVVMSVYINYNAFRMIGIGTIR
jgi:hypothetical protein